MGLYILVSVLIIIVCVLIILVVLVQNSKGGGLASNFSASNQYMGVRKTADFLEKTTWTLAIILLFLTLSSIFIEPKNQTTGATQESEIQKQINEAKSGPVNDFQVPPANKDMPPMQQQTPAQPKKK
ncbi:MAG: preprotein translocase subunit SecG [Bacteroidota bacterium]|nr:preprotein translocase subunit SecG [Bacteroidota bacterium]